MGRDRTGTEAGTREVRVLPAWLDWAVDPAPPAHLQIVAMALVTAFAAAVSWYFGSPPAWLGLVVALTVAGLVWLAVRRLGWLLNGTGLHELRLVRRRPGIGWADLEAVEDTPAALLIHTRQGVVRIPWRMRRARLLAAALREHLDPSADARQPVEPAQIQAWLGLGEFETLPLGHQAAVRATVAAAGLAMLGVLLWLGLRFERGTMWGAAGMLTGPLLSLVLTTERWQVGRGGFRIGDRHVDWSDLVSLRRTRHGWLVEATSARIRLTGRHAARVAKVVEQVLAAQPPQVVRPARLAASDRALSRADAPEQAAERGLSRTDAD